MNFDLEVDILVIGGGGAGLAAAISAADEGASVAVVEKSERPGGNTALSSGSVPGAGTRFQRALGIEDGPEVFADDIMRRTNGTAPAHLVRALAEESAPLVEWLVDFVGAPLRLEPTLRKVGHSVARTHVAEGREGSRLFASLEQCARRLDIGIAVAAPATGLIVDDAGAVIGARLRSERGSEDRIGARKVILACNGFGANRNMLRRHCPEIAEAPYFGHYGNTGDGIVWAEALGACLHNMGGYQGHASVSDPHGTLVSWTIMEMGGCLVNLAGERFADEERGYSGCAADVLQQRERTAFALFDQAIHDYMITIPDYAELHSLGGVRPGSGPEELATAAGIDPAGLARTFASRGWIPAAGRYYIVRVTAGLFHTQGGLYVDRLGRVLRPNGETIRNLYAAGGTAVGLGGRNGGRGYCSASGLLAALGLGRIAGRAAGRCVMEDRPDRMNS